MTQPRPSYHHSWRMVLPFLRALLGRPASLSRTCALMLQDAPVPPRILNAHHIPPTGDFILVMNHYDRPGLGAWWIGALAVTAIAQRRCDPRELRGVMAREWWYPKGWQRCVKQPLTRWAFGQLAKTYGLLTLPPVTEEYKGTGAMAVRRVLALTRGKTPALLGMAPEGRTGENLALCTPPKGAGLFLLLLSHNQIPFLPAGGFEDEENHLTVNFGAPFLLNVPNTLPRAERDREAATQVMVQIGKLLPARMWGVYRAEIERLCQGRAASPAIQSCAK